MSYKKKSTGFDGLLDLQPSVFEDDRGFFFESFNLKEFESVVGEEVNFVQDNHSMSLEGVIRGLHLQLKNPQAKLVRVISGLIYDVVVDLRPTKPTFKQWFGIEISSSKKNMLWIPKGFAHGFQVRSKYAEVIYKTDQYWDKEDDHTLAYDDPYLNIDWNYEKSILSTKDSNGSSLDEIVQKLELL